MKNSLACPKCNGRRLWRIDEIGTTGRHRLRVAVGRKTPATHPPTAFFKDDGSVHYSAGEIAAYICDGCGYTELWSRDFEDLVHNPEDGVHFLDSSNETGEYR